MPLPLLPLLPLLALTLLLASPALAGVGTGKTGPTGTVGPTNPASGLYGAPQLSDWAHDLESDRKGDRLLAARELRRMTQSAHRQSQSKNPFRAQEGLVLLADLRSEVGPAVRRAAVDHANVRRPCAQILASLGDPAALPELRQALAAEARKGVSKQLQRAIDTLEAAQ